MQCVTKFIIKENAFTVNIRIILVSVVFAYCNGTLILTIKSNIISKEENILKDKELKELQMRIELFKCNKSFL